MRPSVVICGSYHADPPGLRRIFQELETTGCRILSPISIDFVDTTQEVVRANYEDGFGIDELERYHLRALQSADFIWLHAPGGHIGLSGLFELGFATAIQKPVYCLVSPEDAMLATQVRIVPSAFAALQDLRLIA
ncbi:hypothetical protein KDA23_07600 [Candidatus Saccharibacteria bacterium]|nr:hypothetical protein [Candidatus Saccharibacteria bacterium]